MTELMIPCPNCGKALRLPDKSMLGRRARCPRCRETFVLQLPEKKRRKRSSGLEFVGEDLPPPPPAKPQEAPPQEEFPQLDTSPARRQPESIDEPTASVASQYQARLRKKKKGNQIVIASTLVAVAAMAGYYLVAHPRSPLKSKPDTAATTVASNNQTAASTNPDVSDPLAEVPAADDAASEQSLPESPTAGTNLSLQYVPPGTRAVIHLRPADIWSPTAGARQKYLLQALGPVGTWAATAIEEVCRRPAEQIERALICLIPGQKGTDPKVATVVTLAEETKRSDLLLEFRGELLTEFGHPIYLAGDQAMLILDDSRTYVIGPRDNAQEMVDAMSYGGITSDGIDELLQQSDTARHFTVLFEPQMLRDFRDNLFSEDLHPLVDSFLDWFREEEIDTIAWSIHLDESFFVEMYLRNRNLLTEKKLQSIVRARLEQLPENLLEAVQSMNPQEFGRRRLVGRLPAMMKVVTMAAQSQPGDRYVKIAANLPQQAGANLALASWLAWDESVNTGSGGAGSPSPQRGPKPIAERLQTPIFAEFAEELPLMQAFTYLGESTNVRIEIDLSALENAGYTRNMPVSFKLGTVPGMHALHEILQQYEDLAVVVDDKADLVTVMTDAAAESKNLQPFEVPAP